MVAKPYGVCTSEVLIHMACAPRVVPIPYCVCTPRFLSEAFSFLYRDGALALPEIYIRLILVCKDVLMFLCSAPSIWIKHHNHILKCCFREVPHPYGLGTFDVLNPYGWHTS